MASYLDRLLTLDEEGTENLETNFEAEQTQDITEVIDADSNSDDINAEAISIEEDIEAMESGTEAVGELAEQEEVNDELLDSPGDISPEVAKATNDAFKVTLASLAIDVRDTVYGNITYDSNRNEPIQVVRITQDGVKDFIDKLKEHIIAFFRTIKMKIQKLIARLAIMFADCSKKAEALSKEIKNKINKYNDRDLVINNIDVKQKVCEYMPIIFIHSKNVKKAINDIQERFIKSSKPDGLENAEKIIKVITSVMKETEGQKKTSSVTAKQLIKKINDTVDSTEIENEYKGWDVPDKKNHETSKPFIVAGIFSKTPIGLAYTIHEDADIMIPSPVWCKCKITQEQIDSVTLEDIKPAEVRECIELCVKLAKNAPGVCKTGLNSIGNIETDIINACNTMAKEGDIKNGTMVKYSSVARSTVVSVGFKCIMEQARVARKLLGMCNYLYNHMGKEHEYNKREDRRK